MVGLSSRTDWELEETGLFSLRIQVLEPKLGKYPSTTEPEVLYAA
jgi:hypothetical protein